MPRKVASVSIVGVSGVSTSVSGCDPRRGGLGHHRPGGLGIGEVVAVLTLHEQVLADLRSRHVLVVHAAADLAGVRLHDREIESDTVEDAFVRLVHHPVALPQTLLVAIEGVGVLHQELPNAEQPEPGAELVAVLPFHLVEVDGQITVGGQIPRDQGGHDFLLGRPEHQLPVMAVGELEQCVAVQVVATRRLPRSRRKHDRHADLARARCVHLFADDGLDRAHRAQPERQRDVDACHHLTHEAGSQQQSVRGDLGVGGIVTQGRDEELRQAHRSHRIPVNARGPRAKPRALSLESVPRLRRRSPAAGS